MAEFDAANATFARALAQLRRFYDRLWAATANEASELFSEVLAELFIDILREELHASPRYHFDALTQVAVRAGLSWSDRIAAERVFTNIVTSAGNGDCLAILIREELVGLLRMGTE